MNFVKLSLVLVREVDDWITENTVDENSNGTKLNFETSHDSRMMIKDEKWKRELDLDLIRNIEHRCSKMMEIYGYKDFEYSLLENEMK